MNIKRSLAACLFTFFNVLWIGVCWAGVLDVPTLVRTSDVIVVGRADTIAFAPTKGVQTFMIGVDQVLKGSPGSVSRRIQVQLDLSAPDSHAMTEHRYGIFFLSNTATANVFTSVDPSFPALVASPNPGGKTLSHGSDPLVSVAQELLQVIRASETNLTNNIAPVEQFKGISPAQEAQSIYHRAAAALATIPVEVAGPGLGAIAQVKGPAQLWAIKSIFDSGSSDEVKVQYLNAAKSILLSPTPEQASGVYWLAHSMEGQLHSASAVPTISALLASKDVAVRQTAASILDDIGTKNTIAPLATSALYDQDQKVRYFAVRGLARVTGLAAAPTLALYGQSEQTYLQFWRQWTKANNLARD
jgi:hypothetical protein